MSMTPSTTSKDNRSLLKEFCHVWKSSLLKICCWLVNIAVTIKAAPLCVPQPTSSKQAQTIHSLTAIQAIQQRAVNQGPHFRNFLGRSLENVLGKFRKCGPSLMHNMTHWVSEWGLTSHSTHYRAFHRWSSRQSLALVQTTKTNSKNNQANAKTQNTIIYTTHIHMHTDVMLANKRRTH